MSLYSNENSTQSADNSELDEPFSETTLFSPSLSKLNEPYLDDECLNEAFMDSSDSLNLEFIPSSFFADTINIDLNEILTQSFNRLNSTVSRMSLEEDDNCFQDFGITGETFDKLLDEIRNESFYIEKCTF